MVEKREIGRKIKERQREKKMKDRKERKRRDRQIVRKKEIEKGGKNKMKEREMVI